MTLPPVTPRGCQASVYVCVCVCVWLSWCAGASVYAFTKCVCVRACCLLMCTRVCQTSGLTSVFEHLHSTHRSKQLPNKSLGESL